jgi:2-polyprenyl-6-methoxyphenol hydroxylase-like FAD-dependent oxidoreductase
MATKPYPHVLIAGAGMSGLTLAHQLQKENISFSIFDRDLNNVARAQGWALSLFGPALADLTASMPAELGPVEQTSHLLPLDLPAQFVFYDITKPGMRAGVISDDSGKIVRCNRQRLRDWLLQGIDVQFGKRLVKVDESDEKVTVHFEDGTSESGDILVGAEGTRSVVRNHILKGQDVMKPLALGSLVGEIELTGDDFARQLSLAHSGYIVMNSTLGSDDQSAIFAALNRVSKDGKTGYYYFILLWVDKKAPLTTDENPYWTVRASKEQLATFAREKTKAYPDYLRVLVDKVAVEGYSSPGFQLQGVQLEAEQLPAGKVIVIGDAAHSMTPCKCDCGVTFLEMFANHLQVRGEAGVCAFTDALKFGRTLTRVRDTQAKGEELKALVAEFRDDMLARGKWAIEVSNPVLEDYGRVDNYKFGTFGKEAVPLAPPAPVESIKVQ